MNKGVDINNPCPVLNFMEIAVDIIKRYDIIIKILI